MTFDSSEQVLPLADPCAAGGDADVVVLGCVLLLRSGARARAKKKVFLFISGAFSELCVVLFPELFAPPPQVLRSVSLPGDVFTNNAIALAVILPTWFLNH